MSQPQIIALPAASGTSTTWHTIGIILGLIGGLIFIGLLIWGFLKIKGGAKENVNRSSGNITGITPGGNKTFGR